MELLVAIGSAILGGIVGSLPVCLVIVVVHLVKRRRMQREHEALVAKRQREHDTFMRWSSEEMLAGRSASVLPLIEERLRQLREGRL